MIGNKLEKWQEVLTNWVEWNQSISDIREHVSKKYGDIEKLFKNARFRVEVVGEDSSPILNKIEIDIVLY